MLMSLYFLVFLTSLAISFAILSMPHIRGADRDIWAWRKVMIIMFVSILLGRAVIEAQHMGLLAFALYMFLVPPTLALLVLIASKVIAARRQTEK